MIKILPIILCMVSLVARAEMLQITVADEKGASLSNAVVYAIPSQPVPTEGLERVEIEQKNEDFQPFISVVPRGTTTYFPNHDGIGHHVYSFSETKTFELPLSEVELTLPIEFDEAGIITVGCNIHDWMVAYIKVVDTPYYTLTDEDGRAMLENLPAGEYTLHIWHPGMTDAEGISQTMELGPGSANQNEFSLAIRPEYFWKPIHPPENEEEEY